MSNMNSLMQQHAVWRARDFVGSRELTQDALSTGYAVLDDALHDHGWPQGGLVEILCDRYGIGELRLLVPALAKLSNQDATWVVWINPPFVPYAPALYAEGVNVQHLLLVYPETHKEALWTLEETLLSTSCKAVLAWLNEDELTSKQLRRIQTHARQNGVWTILFRPPVAASKTSAAELRLRLDPVFENRGDAVCVSILKRRGGWPVENLELKLATHPVPYVSTLLLSQTEQWLALRAGSKIEKPLNFRTHKGPLRNP